MFQLLGQSAEQGIAQESQIGQEIWIARTGAVFAHQGIAPPMVADFHSRPMPLDELEPLARGVISGRGARQVVARFGAAGRCLFYCAFAAQDDQRSGVGEVGLEWFDGKGVDGSFFHAAVTALGLDKKGVFWRPFSAWAFWSSLG